MTENSRVAEARAHGNTARIWELVYALAFNEEPSRPELALKRANEAVRQVLLLTGQIQEGPAE